MFPMELDGAKVLLYTQKDDYGVITDSNGEVADYYHYLAICKYPKDDNYWGPLKTTPYQLVLS